MVDNKRGCGIITGEIFRPIISGSTKKMLSKFGILFETSCETSSTTAKEKERELESHCSFSKSGMNYVQ
jgi:hypothetical protein